MTRIFLLSLCLIAPAAFAEPLDDARAALNSGQYEQALSALNEHLSRQPQDADARFQKGLALVMLERDDEAIRVFSDLARDFPELPEPYNNLAVLYARAGQYEEARDALEAALVSHPGYATAHENLGDIYTALARASYNRAAVLDKNNPAVTDKLNLLSQLQPGAVATPPASINVPARPAATPQPTVIAELVQPRATAAPAPTARPTPRPLRPAATQAPVATRAPVATPAPAVAPRQTVQAPVPIISGNAPVLTGTTPVIGGAEAAQPQATPRPAPDQQAILATVQRWAAAWSAQDVPAYLATYSPNFEPTTGATRSTWESQRRSRIVRPSSITIEVLNPSVFQGTPKFARVDFLQLYESDTYSDQVRKQLELEKLNGKWLIIDERVVR